MWVLVCSCSASGYCQLIASCNSFHVACYWLKQSISIGLQLPHLIFKEQWQYERSHLMFILCCKVWAFRGGNMLGLVQSLLVFGDKCVHVCMYLHVCMPLHDSICLCKTTDSCSKVCYQQNIQLFTPMWRLCVKKGCENLLPVLSLIVHCSRLIHPGIKE